MDRRKGNKLNHILQKWPPGTVAPTVWLRENGISRQLLDRYEEHNWITRVAKGAVVRSGDQLVWEGIVYALQKLQGIDVWLGGKTALQLKGFGHYIPMKQPTLQIYSSTVSKLPRWVFELERVGKFRFKRTKLFSSKVDKVGFTDFESKQLTLNLSSPERAIMELLENIPASQTFEEAQLIFEGLAMLRGKMVQELLENCTSIKVKRLFLYFAEAANHAWFQKLDTSKIDLGKGKRAIVPKGRLDSKYQILIPEGA